MGKNPNHAVYDKEMLMAITYKFSRMNPDGGDPLLQEFTLDRLLVTGGLKTEPKEEGKRSQAETFASYALQCGHLDEDSIFARYEWLNHRPQDASSLITTFRAEVDKNRADKAYKTMKDKGSMRSIPAEQLAKSLMPRLVAAGFVPMRDRIGNILSVDEGEEGPMGADLNKAITRARFLLGERDDRARTTPQVNSTQEAENTVTGDQVPVAVGSEDEEPF